MPENINPDREIEICEENIESSKSAIKDYENEIQHLESNVEVLSFFTENDKPLAEIREEVTLKVGKSKGIMTIKAGSTIYTFKFDSTVELMQAMMEGNVKRVKTLIESQITYRKEKIEDEHLEIEAQRRDIERYKDMKKAQLFNEDEENESPE